ncbi:two-component regulator propeller domain-containing protein [Pedobacter psychroterrae]|uniref:Transcriptional regulator n=1 Tax=Pedobacter psychroterrae TaxID=2530453 RepID=A0A4R0NP32_9SPHI|nr:two-component regulator propeller domain-containing protein [Pedobacter psychroterrae]TCD00955.1 transcriptional regulator [Pedobacter psychroterrae]
MKYVNVYVLFLLSVFLSSCGQNQTNVPKDNVKSEVKDIGPNIMVRNIKKGGNGAILIAGPNNSSLGDVFRYDGKSFTNLTNKIGPHRFWDALEDRRGNIWFTSTDSGVYYYNGKSIQHFTTTEGLANNRVMSVYEDKAGIIWFGTGDGISRYDGRSFRNLKNPNPSRVYKGENWNNDFTWNNDITTIIEDKTGRLWVGTRGAVFVYDGKTFTPLIHKGKTFTNVWSIIEDRKGNIWLGDVTHGLWRYDGNIFTQVSERGTYAIIEDKKGNIWTTGPVNTAHVAVWALSRYDAKSLYSNKPTVAEIMLGDAFFGLMEANDGSIWFGSATGVYRYDGKTITDFYNKEGQKKYIIDTKQSAVVWRGSMLLGSWEGTRFLGDGSHTGDVDILKGELLIENRRLVGGAVEVDMNTIENFVDQRSFNQLPAFFDVKKFPVSTFSITKVETVSDGKTEGRNGNMTIEGVASIKVTGNLSIEGITKAVTFPANMLFKDGMDGTVVMNGTLTIDRTDWGIGYRSEKHFDSTFSDDVKIFIKIVAKK